MIKARICQIRLEWEAVPTVYKPSDWTLSHPPEVTGAIWNTDVQISYPFDFQLTLEEMQALIHLATTIAARTAEEIKDKKLPGDL